MADCPLPPSGMTGRHDSVPLVCDSPIGLARLQQLVERGTVLAPGERVGHQRQLAEVEVAGAADLGDPGQPRDVGEAAALLLVRLLGLGGVAEAAEVLPD